MTDFFQCPRCRSPFLAEDEGRIANRDGLCATCAKIDVLRRMGLSPDFLSGFPGFAP